MAGTTTQHIIIKPSLAKIALKLGGVNTLAELSAGIKYIAQVTTNVIKQEAPVRSRRLVNSMIITDQGPLKKILTERVAYGKYLRAGVTPSERNPILPNRKKALHWPGLAHPVKAVYHHPGIQVNNYVQRGVINSQGRRQIAANLIGKKLMQRYKL